MKKYAFLILLSLFLVIFASCTLTRITINNQEKYEIVSNKYGDISYVNENILVYKHLETEFAHIDGVDYIVENSGNRGSVSPEIRDNFYLMMDIVKQGETYKLLVYNNVLKNGTDKTKAFTLTDYFLPIKIADVLSLFEENNIAFDIKNMIINITKKDITVENEIYDDLFENDFGIKEAYYTNATEGAIIMSFYDYQTQIIHGSDTLVVRPFSFRVY